MYTVLVVLGLCFGSFVNALVWRLHEKRDWVRERSECVRCHHVLAWYDLIPVVSWLTLRGRCRYCKKAISIQYPAVELLTAGLFVLSYVFWPFGFEFVGSTMFTLWLVALVMLVALAVYDLRWMLLPDKIVFPLIGVGILFAGIRFYSDSASIVQAAVEITLGILSVAGLYYILYAVSRHRWVGFGDVKLGVFIGALLGWSGGLFAVMAANVIGLLVILPGLVSGKLTRTSRIPFGPFLIAGCIIALLFAERIITWYIDRLLLGV